MAAPSTAESLRTRIPFGAVGFGQSGAIPVGDHGQPGGGFPTGQGAIPTTAAVPRPEQLVTSGVAFPAGLHSFDPSDAYGNSFGLGGALIDGSRRSYEGLSAQVLKQRSAATAGTNTNGYTSANYLVPRGTDDLGGKLGVPPKLSPMFVKERRGRTVRYGRDLMEQIEVLSLQQLNFMLAGASIKEAQEQMGVAGMDMDDDEEEKIIDPVDLSESYNFSGFLESTQSVDKGSHTAMVVVTSGHYDVAVTWAGNIRQDTWVGFVGKYVPASEVPGGKYTFNTKDTQVLPASTPAMIYQIVPFVGRAGATPTAEDLLSFDNSGTMRMGRLISVGRTANKIEGANVLTDAAGYDAVAMESSGQIQEVFFACATTME